MEGACWRNSSGEDNAMYVSCHPSRSQRGRASRRTWHCYRNQGCREGKALVRHQGAAPRLRLCSPGRFWARSTCIAPASADTGKNALRISIRQSVKGRQVSSPSRSCRTLCECWKSLSWNMEVWFYTFQILHLQNNTSSQHCHSNPSESSCCSRFLALSENKVVCHHKSLLSLFLSFYILRCKKKSIHFKPSFLSQKGCLLCFLDRDQWF